MITLRWSISDFGFAKALYKGRVVIYFISKEHPLFFTPNTDHYWDEDFKSTNLKDVIDYIDHISKDSL